MEIPAALQSLLEKRLKLVDQIAALHAKYGPSGTYITRRDILEAQLGRKHRSILDATEQKVTQGHIQELVKTDPEYLTFITDVEVSREKLFQLYGELKDVTMRIHWITRANQSLVDGVGAELSEEVR